MNSLGSCSKWPSYDSLRSNCSLVYSESEHTEDEADGFSEGEVDGGAAATKSLSAHERLALSAHYLQLASLRLAPHLSSRAEQQTSQWPDPTQPVRTVSPPSASSFGPSAVTQGDVIFAQKCASLRQFIQPLLELLHGLKTGRFDKGLSSFQQSVAMDRLQRILGVLQKPEMGEKYLRNLLQIEVMLKIWFPQVAFQSEPRSQSAVPRAPTQWRRSQLHIPVKKRKLNWSEHNHMARVPAKQPRQQLQRGTFESCRAATATLDGVSTSQRHRPQAGERLDSAAAHQSTTTRAAALSRLSCLRNQREGGKQPAVCESPAGQDSSVSSSDTFTLQQLAPI